MIIFEENINSLATGRVLFPDTIHLLFIFVLILGLIVKYFHLKNITIITVVFSVLGYIFEITVGNIAGHLFDTPIFFTIFITIWIGISYAFIFILPLTILLTDKKSK